MSDIFISNFLKKSINAYNDNRNDDTLDALRGALIGYINGDPGFETSGFDDAIKYTISQGIKESELFDQFDPNKEIEEDKSKWTKKYFIQQIVYLEDNFCKKRINHIKEIAKYIYANNSSTSSLSLLKDISSYINTISKSESSIIKEIQSLKKNNNIDMKNVTKAVTYIEKQYNLVLKYYTNKFKSIIKE